MSDLRNNRVASNLSAPQVGNGMPCLGGLWPCWRTTPGIPVPRIGVEAMDSGQTGGQTEDSGQTGGNEPSGA
jgi:hypothetical protein